MLLPMRKVVIVLVGALAVTGCGNPDAAAEPQIATLRSTAAQSTPSADVQDRRPLVRADTSKEEMGRIFAVWTECLRVHGVPGLGVKGGWKPTEEEGGPHTAAYQACREHQPESTIERLKRQDYVEYSDRYRAFLKCLRDAGVDVSADGDGPLIKFNRTGDSFNDRITKLTSECEKTTEFQ